MSSLLERLAGERRRGGGGGLARGAGAGGPLFITQDEALPNACGTIALIHGCTNALQAFGGPVALPEGAWLRAFAERATPRTSVERAALLSTDPALESKHDECVLRAR